MTKTESLGKRIQELRKKRNMTQQELADKTGFTQSTISKMETEKNGRVDSDVLLGLANAFQIPGLEIVKGTSGEELASFFLLRRFCANHEHVYIIDRLQDGFENKFCYDCGQELRGDCQHCGTPIEALSANGRFCHACGGHFDPFWEEEDPKYDELKIEQYGYLHMDMDLERSDYIGPARLCLAPHEVVGGMHQVLEKEYPAISEGEIIRALVFPKFSFTGEVKYCPECGQETIDACPHCGRPIFKHSPGHILNFCAGCGLNFREFRPEAGAKSSG